MAGKDAKPGSPARLLEPLLLPPGGKSHNLKSAGVAARYGAFLSFFFFFYHSSSHFSSALGAHCPADPPSVLPRPGRNPCPRRCLYSLRLSGRF